MSLGFPKHHAEPPQNGRARRKLSKNREEGKAVNEAGLIKLGSAHTNQRSPGIEQLPYDMKLSWAVNASVVRGSRVP